MTMKNDLKALWFLIFCSLATLLISGQQGLAYPDTDVCTPSYSATTVALPTAGLNYSVPEPGLTNETMTIFGSAGYTAGKL